MADPLDKVVVKMGLHVKRLVAWRMSVVAIDPNKNASPLQQAFAFLTGDMVQAAKDATAWVEEQLAKVKACADNPWKDDEEIAKAILDKANSLQRTDPK